MNYAIVMAAGKGTRMKSEKAKTMHEILGKPMVGRIYDTLKKSGIDDIVFVVGHGHEQLEAYLKDSVQYAIQNPQLGTGHAVMQATALKGKEGKTLIINGDCPLITEETYRDLLKETEENQLVVLTMVYDDPKSYGRIIRDENGQVLRIVEKRDASPEQLLIREVNAGIYCVDNELLWKYLPEITNDNDQKEYYVTDLVEIFNRHNHKVSAVITKDNGETQGVNDRQELASANRWLMQKTNRELMKNGITIIDPERTMISPETVIGKDTVIYPGVRIEGNTEIGENNIIEEGCILVNCHIGNGNHIYNSRLENYRISDNQTVFCQVKSENNQ